jgi:ParB family transcriptional regulator, chromosome partitioning protein
MSEDIAPAIPLRRRPSGLGRGLSALLGEIEQEAPVSLSGPAVGGIKMVDVSELSPHPDQPRRHFDETALDELARSITTRGLLQPIVVRVHLGHYQIIAGERRWRAAQRARIHQVPVIIKEIGDSEALEIALIENIQREQLNAIEEGEAYRKLISEFGHSQEILSGLVHKSRSHIANLMRLGDLPAPVRQALADGRLSMGHARALLTAADPVALMDQVLARGLSVRETEKLAKGAKAPAIRSPRAGTAVDPDLAALERQLGDLLGLKVRIAHQAKTGTVTLHYSTLEQLDMICQRLSGEAI